MEPVRFEKEVDYLLGDFWKQTSTRFNSAVKSARRAFINYVPISIESPGGGRIKDKRDPKVEELTDSFKGYRGKEIKLHKQAYDAYLKLKEAALKDGIQSPLLLISSGYRSFGEQKRLWNKALIKHGSPSAARKWVAPPGKSAHQSGRALDLYLGYRIRSENAEKMRNTKAYKWLSSNAIKFGFYPYRREPWHWEYNPPSASLNHSGGLLKSNQNSKNIYSDNSKTSGGVTTTMFNHLQRMMNSGFIGMSVFLAILQGNRDSGQLTDMVFFQRHPERNGKKIQSHERNAIHEWKEIRSKIIIPILSSRATGIPSNNHSSSSTTRSSNLLSRVEKYKPIISKYSQIFNVSDKIITGIIAAESGGDPKKRSIANYKGLMQAGREDAHYSPEISIREGAKKFSRFQKIIIQEVQKRIDLNISNIGYKELAQIVLSGYNAGPVTVIKAIEYAHKDGNWRNWLDAQNYQRALIFSGGFSTKYRNCLKGKSSREIAEGKKQRFMYAGWRKNNKLGWRQYPDPPELYQLKIQASAILLCWVNTKHSNTYKYLRKFSKYL